jgi:hypothetical protein
LIDRVDSVSSAYFVRLRWKNKGDARLRSFAARQQLTTNFPERIMQTAQIYGEAIRNNVV